MTDYNRHLEQLVEKTENLLTHSLKTKVSKENISEIEKYQALIERVRELSHDDCESVTMTIATNLFLQKIDGLLKLLNEMRNLENSVLLEVTEIETNLKKLKEFVEQDKCLNAGGKFEWVDSILVKCLQEGTWLLIDQVNLCSPAVLDRLNGLLEPKGVLSIGERGVDSEGNVVTIKPHENFRLFLTMDPRYGEISRAMRNRGVEIYMLNYSENPETGKLDYRSLLHHSGLVKRNHQEALMMVHKCLSEDPSNVDNLNVIQLLHSAFLVVQQLSRGFPVAEAFKSSCIDVYLKARSIFHYETRMRLSSIIEDTIREFGIEEGYEYVLDLDAATCSLNNLQDNSKLTFLRQQGLLLDWSVKGFLWVAQENEGNKQLSLKTDFINELFAAVTDKNHIQSTEVLDTLPHILLNFYEHSSVSDVDFREIWASNILQKNAKLEFLEKKNSTMAQEILTFDLEDSDLKLPWDSKHFANANNLALLLYYETLIVKDNMDSEWKVDNKEKTISVAQFSEAHRQGKMTGSNLKYNTLITNFVAFLLQVKKFIDNVLRYNKKVIDNSKYVVLRQNLKYFNRFCNLGKLVLLSKTESPKNLLKHLDEVELLLKVHYKWLKKFLKFLDDNYEDHKLNTDYKKESNLLKALLNEIDNSFITAYDPFRKICKIYKKHINSPLPCSSDTALKACSRLQNITDSFSPSRNKYVASNLLNESKFVTLQTDEALKIRSELMNLWHNIYANENLDENVFEILDNMSAFCQKRLNITDSSEESMGEAYEHIPSPKDIIKMTTKIQLWPIHEYMFSLFVESFRRKLSEQFDTTEDHVSLPSTYLSSHHLNLPNIPIELLAILKAICTKQNDHQERNRLLFAFSIWFDKFSEHSFAIKRFKQVSHWRNINPDQKDAYQPEIADRENLTNGPVLVSLISELILNTSQSSNPEKSAVVTGATLGSYGARLEQLKTLNDTLWKNSVALNSSEFNHASNDLRTLKSLLKEFLTACDKVEADTSLKQSMKSERLSSNVKSIVNKEYLQPLDDLRSISETLTEDTSDINRGTAWTLLGYLQSFVFGNMSYIDPVYKVSIKLRYIDENINDCQKTLYVAKLYSRILGLLDSHIAHPRLQATEASFDKLMEEKDSLQKLKAVRPANAEFIALSKEFTNFRTALGSYAVMNKHVQRLTSTMSDLKNEINASHIKNANSTKREAEIWLESMRRFMNHVESKYISGYPDIVYPILAGLGQMRHGIRILIDENSRLVAVAESKCNSEKLGSFVRDLVRFPTIGPQQENLLSLIQLCTSLESRELLRVNVKSNNTFVTLQEQFRLTIAGLYEFYNYVVLKGDLTKDLWSMLNNLLQQIVIIWRQQQKEMERREAEKDSLYKNRVKIQGDSLTEEEQIAQELKSLFPTHREDDFADVDSSLVPSLEKQVTLESQEEDFGALITENDIKEVQNIHSSIIKSFTSSEWLLKTANESSPDFIEPLLERYKTFGLLFDNVAPALDHELSSKLYISLNVLTQLVARLGQGETLNPNSCINTVKKNSNLYDYYRDSNVEEVKQCVPLLESISTKISQLLKEWPEHPTLVSIRIIIQRINSFPVTSAVSRFLTGLEMLLVKMHEWEENAHSGVSLTELILTLTKQIISWRKLELACWKDCLTTAQLRLKSQTSKWWFFLYELFESYVSKAPSSDKSNDEVTAKKLIESLEIFMSESTFAQFEARLELLLTFHCHTYYLTPSLERDNVLAISWNIYNYYSQFLNDVRNRINAIRAPIEKKLKDFVKIARWNDINYWSVKETVEKTHRTLHKYIKEYETGLKDTVTPFLVVKPTYKSEAGIWDKQKSDDDYCIDANDYLAPIPQATITDISINSDLISRADSHYLSRAKKLCKEAILTSVYPSIRVSFEEFVEDFTSHSARLRALEVDRNQTQPKQKSQAKNILQQKRMALADYFKTLQGFGLSHRIGVLAWKNKLHEVLDFTIPPVELKASFSTIGSGKFETKMLDQWEGCERYYYGSLIKLNALNRTLVSTKTDLGPQNMEWCKGFSTHLMLLANKQKKILASVLKYFVSLRSHVLDLAKINSNDSAVAKQKDLWLNVVNLKELLITAQTTLEQVLIYLQACPTQSLIEGEDDSYNLDTNDLPIVNCNRGDELWVKTNNYAKDCLKVIADLSKKFQDTFPAISVATTQTSIITSKHFEFLKKGCITLMSVKEKIQQFAAIFDAAEDGKHPLLENINFLETSITSQLEQFEKINVSINEQVESEILTEADNLNSYEGQFEKLVNMILIVIQNKYKNNLAPAIDDQKESESDKEDEEEDDEYEKNKLKEKLVESIEKDIVTLKLQETYEILNDLLRNILDSDSRTVQNGFRLLQKCLPLLQQYVLFAQFYLYEQVASLRITCKILHMQLNVFLDLATNGFCVPKDLDLEEGDEGSEEKTGKGGMGLGDGEGEKDVSEQIETEDQLEDAKPAGQEKEKPEDKECPEEDNGIEMSEDFEGQLQDVEPKEDEDGNKDEEDDDDIDKQMGDTADGSDKLDEQIWGDDEDEPESEETEKKDDEIGDGERTGEKEFGAKDERTTEDSEDKGNDDGDDERKEEQKEINEMEEPEYDEDQVNPYHGKHQPEPEPEPLDLPEDMNMDDEDGKDDEPNDEENPFDIDKMKESMPPPETEEMETAEEEIQEDKDNKNPDSSDEEDANDPEKPADKAEQDEAANEDGNEEESAQKAPDSGKDGPEEDQEKSEEKEQEQEEKALPSSDEASKEMDAAEQTDQQEGGSKDQVANQTENEPDQQDESNAENWQDEKKDKGTGQSQAEQHDSGHSGSSAEKTQPANKENEAKQNEKRKNPGKSDEDHTLAEKLEPDKKKLRTMIHSKDKAAEDDNNEEGAEQDQEGDPDICQHVKEKEKFDHYAVDAATEEQSKEQASNMDQEKDDPSKDEEDVMDVDMHEDEEVQTEEEPVSKQNSEKVSNDDKSKDKKDSKEKGRTEDGQLETVVDIEGETTETMTVQRGAESAFFTNLTEVENEMLSTRQIEIRRTEVEKMLSQWTQVPTTGEAVAAWNALSSVTDAPARDLSEKLRLVLEPTQASRLKGDYRTGRRINMRKIIPYIASQFRKDKIWLRRTKPSKRDYQIVLAIDDSSSMADNHSKELAFESLSLISKAMTYLEAGQLSVLSFGEQTNILHPLGETFSEHSGSRLMQEMRFEQKKTMIGQLVDFTVDMFQSQCNSTENAKLLVVLSDGRGVFSEGTDKVNRAVRRARLADIFLVFIIVDNPLNKDSILDIRMPVFQGGKLIGINSYMDSFPFPFYLILRDINALPGVLSDALRQWFEVVGKIDT